jgi:hypothetical protein
MQKREVFVICTRLDTPCDIIEVLENCDEAAERVMLLRRLDPNQKYWYTRTTMRRPNEVSGR